MELSPRFQLSLNIFLIVLLSSACSAVRPPPLPQAALALLPEGALSARSLDSNHAFRTDLAQALAKRLASRPSERAVRMLALSGGGAHGAFGVGVMEGWTLRGDRPDFDIVTGISTGALMAPFIFLGHRFDPILTKLYSSVQVSRIYTNRPLSEVFKELSLKDPGPLRGLIREIINDEFVELIAHEHQSGRRLFVGTTDLDLQRSVVWDLGAIALSNSVDKVPKIRDILLASSSVPLIFPPVYFAVAYGDQIYRQMHVDGGIESPLLVTGLMSELDSALNSLKLNRKDYAVEVFALANQQIEVDTIQPVEPGMVAIAVATINHSLRSNLTSNLARLQLLSQALSVDLKVLSIPPGARLERDSLEFDDAEMKMLYHLGLQLGSSRGAWK
jgi:predicted acylesterase/phospholipase RssA